MSKDFVFTRYLYEKEEIELALTFALLYKKDDEALFWAYELYYSGFKSDLIELLWCIYYNFYASMNPAFQIYLLKKFKEPIFSDARTIGCVINNLIIRPYNLDVFTLRQKYIEKNDEIKNRLLDDKFTTIFDLNLSEKNLFEKFISYFDLDKTKMKKIFNKNIPIDSKIILISQILYYYGMKMNKQMGKKLYVQTTSEDIIVYETIQVNLKCKEDNKLSALLPAYKILPLACLYSVNDSNYLDLFKLKRKSENIKDAYLNCWLNYACKSPVWLERIVQFNGVIDYENNKITFANEETEEEFYQHFGYEPDEQKKEVQDKSILEINKIQSKTWDDFYEDFNKNTFL